MDATTGGGETAAAASLLLRLHRIEKSFSGIPALKAVDFELRAGEVHALAGENGAGKSTFIKIIGGAYAPDAGTIEIGQQTYPGLTPAQARRLGVAIVYQEFNLLPFLSVAENMFLGDLPRGRMPGYSAHRAERKAAEILVRLGSRLDPSRLVGELTVAEQQLVEISAALALDSKIIVLDEPSTVLADHELGMLHDVIRRLRAEGRGLIYISHRLDEVLGLADRVTVFKDGERVVTAPTRDMTHDGLVRAMIGRSLGDFFPHRAIQKTAAKPILATHHLGVAGKLFDVSLAIGRGEIVGVAGLGGSGKTTLCRALVGLEVHATGTVEVAGHRAPRTPRGSARAGLVLVPEDRKAHGIFAGHSISFNLTVSALWRLTRFLLVSGRKERALVDAVMGEFDVRPRKPALDIAKLSGGNQQKVVLGRWLSGQPRIILLDEPTRGVDVGAKAEIYALVARFADAGAAILMASSDVTELLGQCDRIVVFREGRLIQTIQRVAATEEAVIRAATMAAESDAAPPQSPALNRFGVFATGELRRSRLRRWLHRNLVVALIYATNLAFAVVASILSPAFREFGNITDILRQSSVLGLVTIGQVFVMLAGGIDMSIGMIARVVGLGVAVAMTKLGISPFLSITLGLVGGVVIGLVNGVLVGRFGAQPFIATLGTMGILYGGGLAVSSGPTQMVPPGVLALYDANLGPVPAAVIAMIVIWALTGWVLSSTRFGRAIYAVGGSHRVARLAGLATTRVTVTTYMLSGLFSAAAGAFLIARSGVGNPNMALGLEFQSIVTAAIGGISLYGGRGTVFGALGAVLLITMIGNVFDLFQISAYYQSFALGLIVVLAVALPTPEKTR